MSLLGRLEDLSLTDIIQIVFLSRRTGVLEIIDSSGRHTVLFRQGLIVNASAPDAPDLAGYLERRGNVPSESVRVIRQMEESGIAFGTAILEMNLISIEDLGDAIKERVTAVVGPLLQSREGEFNFILSESISALDIEYDPDTIFKEGGLSPQKIVGGVDGEKIKPLRGLEESLKAGKALLRGAASAETTPASLNLGLGQPLEPAVGERSGFAPGGSGSNFPATSAAALDGDNVVPFPPPAEAEALRDDADFAALDAAFPVPDAPQPRPAPTAKPPGKQQSSTGQFKVAGGLFEIESPDAAFRNVVLFERNPLVRVAAKRAFSKNGVKIFQFGSIDDVRTVITDLFRSNSFFVTFLELANDDSSLRLMQQLKRRNPRLPIVLIDDDADLRRRHDLLRAGADLYLTKPSQARLQPGLAEEELALFADELVLFAERSFSQWEQMTGSYGPEAGKKFYEIASQETVDRSFSVLKQLINELSNPNDIGQVAQTILRLSAEYLERGALFMATPSEFVGLGGFGSTGGIDTMDQRVRMLRLPRGEASVLRDVVDSREAHHGKMRRAPVNVQLVEGMGSLLPTEVAALPIIHGQQAIGILYGDNAEHRTPIDTMTGLEIFLSQAGYAFGNAVFASQKAGQGLDA